jgi:prepilin-type N-terminal cleavage/methylation domain
MSSGGFSLIEVMIAILVLGFALAGLTQGLTTALGSSKESELQATAASYAAGRIELLRAEGGLKEEDTDGDCGVGLELYRWRQSIAKTGVEGLYEVTVTIESAANGKPIYELKTLLFELPVETTDNQQQARRGGTQ